MLEMFGRSDYISDEGNGMKTNQSSEWPWPAGGSHQAGPCSYPGDQRVERRQPVMTDV